MIRDGGVYSLAIARQSELDAAELAPGPDFGLPDELARVGIERVCPAALLARHNQSLASSSFDEDRSCTEIKIEVIAFGVVSAAESPDIFWRPLERPDLFARPHIEG